MRILLIILFFNFLFSLQTSFAAPTFHKGVLEIENKKVEIEIARTDIQRSHGLMYRKHLAQDAGMLFIFDKEEPQGFWMKNTLISLSIGFFDRNQRLVDIQEMDFKTSDKKIYQSKKPALYALEMNKGWFTTHKIKVGSKFPFKEK